MNRNIDCQILMWSEDWRKATEYLYIMSSFVHWQQFLRFAAVAKRENIVLM